MTTLSSEIGSTAKKPKEGNSFLYELTLLNHVNRGQLIKEFVVVEIIIFIVLPPNLPLRIYFSLRVLPISDEQEHPIRR